MATRQETARRRRALVGDVRRMVSRRSAFGEEMLPSVRELAAQYDLAVSTVHTELQPFRDEGSIVSVPGLGMRVAHRRLDRDQFIFVVPNPTRNTYRNTQHQLMRIGFEDRLTSLGATTIPLAAKEWHHLDRAKVDSLGGVCWWNTVDDPLDDPISAIPIPRVGSGYRRAADDITAPTHDAVIPDDHAGGVLATEHLIAHGHRRIAFLGSHPNDRQLRLREYSAERERGWRAAMVAAELAADLICAQPRVTGTRTESGHTVAGRLLHHLDTVTAVVGTDDRALLGLVAALRGAGIAIDDWPAMVGFEDFAEIRPHALTSLRTPWSQMGAAAAQLLWDRSTGALTGDPVLQRIPFTLIPRLDVAGTPARSESRVSAQILPQTSPR